MTVAEYKSDLKNMHDTPYLTLVGELWGIYYKDFVES